MSLREKRTRSRGRRLRLAAGVVVCATVVTLTRVVPPGRMTGDAELATLLDRRAALGSDDDRTREELRRTAARARREPALAAVRAGLGPAWHWRNTPDGWAISREVARRDWPAVAAAVATLERGPGVALRSLAIDAGGARPRHAPLRVAIEIRKD